MIAAALICASVLTVITLAATEPAAPANAPAAPLAATVKMSSLLSARTANPWMFLVVLLVAEVPSNTVICPEAFALASTLALSAI